MSPINKTRAIILVSSLVLTFVIIRTTLYFYPNADFDVLGYNIHHLYTGLVLIIFAGIPLILYPLKGLISHFATIIFGVGLSLAIDEWVYLIATDGENNSYFLPVSFWGGLIMVGLTSIYIGILYLFFSREENN
jgi:hypothetical protein